MEDNVAVRSARDMRARLALDLTALHKDILSCDFFHQGNLPPMSQRQDYRLVSNNLKTPMEYEATYEHTGWVPLLFDWLGQFRREWWHCTMT